MTEQAFEEWFASEKKKGLVDIKVAVRPGSDASAEDLLKELMSLDAAVKAGHTIPLPSEGKYIPEKIEDIFRSVSI